MAASNASRVVIPQIFASIVIWSSASGHRFARQATLLPAFQGNERPHSFDQSERPRSLHKAVNRSEGASEGKAENAPRARIFKRIEEQHQGDSQQAEERQRVKCHCRPSRLQRLAIAKSLPVDALDSRSRAKRSASACQRAAR